MGRTKRPCIQNSGESGYLIGGRGVFFEKWASRDGVSEQPIECFDAGFKNGACKKGQVVLFFFFILEGLALGAVLFLIDIENQCLFRAKERHGQGYRLDSGKEKQQEKGNFFHGYGNITGNGDKGLALGGKSLGIFFCYFPG